MTEYVRKKISVFLAQFVEMKEGSPIPESDVDFVSAIELLIREKVFTKDELRHDCLRDYGVIIPEWLFGVYGCE